MVDNGITTDWQGPSAPSSASSSLLERVKAHDPEAWRRLIEIYTPLIYGWCRQCGLQAEDAADIGQEVFSAVAANREGFRRDGPRASFRGWLWTIARNKIRDYFRRQKGKAQAQGGSAAQQQLAQVPEDEPGSTVTGAARDNRIELQVVERIRAGVEERTWQAFWLVAVNGKEPAAVAESLGLTVQAVYGAVYRVRQRIRRELDGLVD
jgi:RNA polymerase sigma-70 factor (ECF subfamily)